MSSIQYTIRSVSPKLDKTLRERAKASGKSLNQIVLDSLATGAGVSETPQVFHDLDWFVGSLPPDAELDAAMEWLDSLPKDDSDVK